MDAHPQAYLWVGGGLITLVLGWTVIPLARGKYDAGRGHDWWWSLIILAILAAGRWPSFLFSRELSPDESQMLAGAHALTYDPVFWRSVNGWTAGPLDFFALWPAGWLCGWDSFLPARLTAAALLAISLLFVHQVMAVTLGRQTARIAGLTGLILESLTHAADFLHYSSELVSVALLSVAAYAAVRRWATQGGPLWSGLGALMLGAVPFGKLQAAPLAAGMGICWLWAELQNKAPLSPRHRAYLIGGALLPAALFASQLAIADEWRSFVTSYLLFNVYYAGEGTATLGQSLVVMLGNALWWDGLLPLALLGGLGWLTVLLRLRPAPHRVTRVLTWAALAGCAGALGSIIWPQRPYLHYWQLLLVPGVLMNGVLIARLLSTSPPRWRRPEQLLVALGLVGLVGVMLHHRARNPNSFVGGLAYYWNFTRSDLAVRIAARSQPGETLAIWGRTDHVFVETGLVQASRDSHIQFLVEASPLQEYFRHRYLTDILHAKPALFLDSTGPASLFYAATEFAHDRNYPELAAVIRANYVLVEDVGGARIYRRRDLIAR